MIQRELAVLPADGWVIDANLAIRISPNHARWFNDPSRLIQIINVILQNELVVHWISVLLDEVKENATSSIRDPPILNRRPSLDSFEQWKFSRNAVFDFTGHVADSFLDLIPTCRREKGHSRQE